MTSIIALNGPSGGGKSAVANALAHELDYRYLSIGLVYRALAWVKETQGDIYHDVISDIKLVPSHSGGGYAEARVLFRARDITSELYGSAPLEASAATMAQERWARDIADVLVHRYCLSEDVVLEGQTTHAIFPSVDISFYLWADEDERTACSRRVFERREILNDRDTVQVTTNWCDRLDLPREIDPLRLQCDMVAWDSTHATLDATVKDVTRYVYHHQHRQPFRISVIIPVRDQADHLDICLARLRNQTTPQDLIEIIVVDDGSTDDSAERARQHGVRVCLTAPRGRAAARNCGLAESTGDIVVFLDADMLVEPDFLAQHTLLHARANNLVVLGARRHLAAGTTIPTPQETRRDSREVLCDHYSYNLACIRHPWSLAYTCNLSVSRSLLADRLFEERFEGWGLEDIELAYRLHCAGARWAFSRRASGYHLFHDRTMTASRFEQWCQNLNLFIRLHNKPEVRQLNLFARVFDPTVRADSMDVFKEFNGGATPLTRPAHVLFGQGCDSDPLMAVQDQVYAQMDKEVDLFVVDDDMHCDYEISLATACPSREIRFYSPEDWARLGLHIAESYRSQGLVYEEMFLH